METVQSGTPLKAPAHPWAALFTGHVFLNWHHAVVFANNNDFSLNIYLVRNTHNTEPPT